MLDNGSYTDDELIMDSGAYYYNSNWSAAAGVAPVDDDELTVAVSGGGGLGLGGVGGDGDVEFVNCSIYNDTRFLYMDYNRCLTLDEHIREVENYVFTISRYEYLFIIMHAIVFVVGLVGNLLVCLIIYQNQNMRTVTNYFIVNLALADFLVILVCLPPTILWDVTETWFFGVILCKVVVYVQSVSVSVSVLTLTFISMDRWYAICFPLKFKSTTGKAKYAICVIWLISMSLAFPDVFILDVTHHEMVPAPYLYLSSCTHTWSDNAQKIYQVILTVLLYLAPFLLMSVAYHQIVRVLWTNDIPGSRESRLITDSTNCKKSLNASKSTKNANGVNATAGQIRSRRKAAKMLIAVVAMFGICYFPVHLFNVLRSAIDIPSTDAMIAASQTSHLLCYANSAMNPVIYNFMSGKFRNEFRKVFTSNCCHKGDHRRPTRNMTLGRYTTTLTHFEGPISIQENAA